MSRVPRSFISVFPRSIVVLAPHRRNGPVGKKQREIRERRSPARLSWACFERAKRWGSLRLRGMREP